MLCKIQKNKNNKINGILNQAGEVSTLFQQIFNTPTLSLMEAIDTYKNIYSDEFKELTVEPIATFNDFNTYVEAVKNTPINDIIKIDIEGVNVAEITNNGDINDLIRQDI